MISQSKELSDIGQGDQNYLASISDVMAALIFVFIIMLALFAYKLSNVTEEQTIVTERLTASDETREHILGEIAKRLEEFGMNVEVLQEQGVLRLSKNAINFPSGSEIPIPDHQFNVGRLAQALAEVVPCYVSSHREALIAGLDMEFTETDTESVPSYCLSATRILTYNCEAQKHPWLLETLLIEGHTDRVPVIGDRRFQDNLELSSMRAATVYRMIAACEPRIERMRNSENVPVLSTSGYGFTRPATRDSGMADYNRRIDLRLLLEPPVDIFSSPESNFQEKFRRRIGEESQ
ncbi:MAG: hypothetical protein OXE92_08840 [Bacteroidetes bacterium]|nr:hypothetical protein [Bacteroidota bacterium]MCY4205814.1 hypothetical protein [Bacteroidota bacterium]